MRRFFLLILMSFTLLKGYCQRPVDIWASISPAFPIGALSDYVGGGFDFIGGIQTEIKHTITLGGELALHGLSDDYNRNGFFNVSAYALRYFKTNYLLGKAPLKPYVGLGLGLYRSQYTDYFYGDDPPQTGLVFSPRFGIRMDADRYFLAGEGRLHLSTGYADSYVPILITFGYKFGGQ